MCLVCELTEVEFGNVSRIGVMVNEITSFSCQYMLILCLLWFE